MCCSHIVQFSEKHRNAIRIFLVVKQTGTPNLYDFSHFATIKVNYSNIKQQNDNLQQQ